MKKLKLNKVKISNLNKIIGGSHSGANQSAEAHRETDACNNHSNDCHDYTNTGDGEVEVTVAAKENLGRS